MPELTPTLVMFNSALLCSVIVLLWKKLTKLEESSRAELLRLLDQQRQEMSGFVKSYQDLLVQDIQALARLSAALQDQKD